MRVVGAVGVVVAVAGVLLAASLSSAIPTYNKQQQQQLNNNKCFPTRFASSSNNNNNNNNNSATNVLFTSFLQVFKDEEDGRSEPLQGAPVLHPETFLQPSDGVVIETNKKFALNCKCNQQVPLPLNNKIPMFWPKGSCGAGEVKFKKLSKGEGMTEEEVRERLGDPIQMKWVYVPEHHFSGMGGRTDVPVLTTPGADMGIFINALDVFETLLSRHLRDHECLWYFRRYLQLSSKRSFCMNTDTIATRMLQSTTGFIGLDLRETPEAHEWNRLLDELSLPEHTGCPHIRNMMMKPEEYDIRPGLTECAVRAFYKLLWNKRELMGRKLRLVEMDGTNKEKAVIKIKASKICNKLKLAPLIQPRTNQTALIVTHSEAAAFMKEELAKYFASFSRWIDGKRFLKEMDANHVKYEDITIWKMAKMSRNLPVYQVTIE